MRGRRTIYFKNRTFLGYSELVDYWNKDKPDFMHANPRNVAMNIQKWEQKNRGKKINDDLITRFLTTRKARNAILYRKKYYAGPAEVYRDLEDKATVGYKSFHLKYSNWRKENTDTELTDDIIDSFAGNIRFKSDDGRWMSETRLKWEQLDNPKVGWTRLAQKLSAFRKGNNREPTDDELAEIARPDEWMQYDSRYTDDNGKLIPMESFYNLFDMEKVALIAWKHRVTKLKKRLKRNITASEAVDLMQTWGAVDNTRGLLYRWTNKINGKVYIGITTETLEERTRGHMRQVTSGDYPDDGLHADIAQYGIDTFNIETLGEYENIEDLVLAECEAIETHKCLSPNGYNLDEGGKGVSLKAFPLKFRGMKFKNLTALADYYDVPVKRIESRLRLGWSMSEAVDIPRGMKKDKPYHLLSDKSISTLAKDHGISPAKVYERISKYNWSLDEALGIVHREGHGGKAKQVTVAGKTFLSHREAAKYFGIPEGTWRKRLKLGWTLEQTAGLSERPQKEV